MRTLLLLTATIFWITVASCQIVFIGPQDHKPSCDSETVEPNLKMARAGKVVGLVIDPSHAAFANQTVQLRSEGRVLVITNTDANGRFNLGELKRGEYRLLFGGREWIQPTRLGCSAKTCELDLLIRLKSTDSDSFQALGCPVK